MFYKPHEEYDSILKHVRVYHNFYNSETAEFDFFAMEIYTSCILYVALLLYFLEIVVP